MVNVRVVNNVEYITLDGKTYYMREPSQISCRPHINELIQVGKESLPVLTLQLANHPNFRAVIHCASPPILSFYDGDDYLPELPLDRYDYGEYHFARLSDGDIFITISQVDRYLVGSTYITRYIGNNDMAEEWDSEGVNIFIPERYHITW
jgi:hypothetical protein